MTGAAEGVCEGVKSLTGPDKQDAPPNLLRGRGVGWGAYKYKLKEKVYPMMIKRRGKYKILLKRRKIFET